MANPDIEKLLVAAVSSKNVELIRLLTTVQTQETRITLLERKLDIMVASAEPEILMALAALDAKPKSTPV